MARIETYDKKRPGGVGFYATDVDQSQERQSRQTYQPGKVMNAAAPAVNVTSRAPLNGTAAKPQEEQRSYSGGGGGGGYGGNQPYADQLNALYDQIVNRKPFQYELNGDLLYRQMADQYTQLGQQAMRDTMGQAAALTGGYGNSYAEMVGQQANQQYLSALNAQIPSLYEQALNAYIAEGDQLLQRYQLAAAHPGYLAALQPSTGGGGGSAAAAAAEEEQKAVTSAGTPYAAALGAMLATGALNGSLGGALPGNPVTGANTQVTPPTETTYDPSNDPMVNLYYQYMRPYMK